ncbi:hypothetical protein B0H34DRAFT_821021 [Crassisporium funariophilum]|nr:hypothetical protein B0H34DRAFT_821021 [Crassisporium funariophilum]
MDSVYKVLIANGTTISNVLMELLSDTKYQSHPMVTDLCAHADQLCAVLQFASTTASWGKNQDNGQWAFNYVKRKYKDEIRKLVVDIPEFKFSAVHASAEQIDEFKVDEMADKIKDVAPNLWDILGELLESPRKTKVDGNLGEERNRSNHQPDQHWAECDEVDLEGIISDITQPAAREQQKDAKRQAILTIRKVILISIIMQSNNRNTNSLESIIGIFLHSCHTPQRVIDTLAHMGVSISVNTIHNAITSLSRESADTIREMGQTLLIAYAYDNFDVDLKSAVPTVEKSATSLQHLTSALIFPLQHGVKSEDLKCSQELWKKSQLNPNALPADVASERTWKNFLELHPEEEHQSHLTRRQRFNSWKFLSDLFNYGPQYFMQFKSLLQNPEAIEMIPLVKTPTIPVRAMEYSNSTVSGNISTIRNLTEQGGVGDPTNQDAQYFIEDATLYVILFHGDLGTGDRIYSIQLRRSIERTPWNRFQYVAFVPGLFHVKMACADAMWRMFLQPSKARDDNTALMKDVSKLRPRETGIIGSNPGFRRMHQVILHTGICRRLECWRVLAQQQSKSANSTMTLDDFAASAPSLKVLEEMANKLAQQYVSDGRLAQLRRQPEEQRDQQYENALLINKFSLLYEEISYAMNFGDIGRVETCLVPWIFIFKATGKHKYAAHMTKFLSNIHFVYPAGLK